MSFRWKNRTEYVKRTGILVYRDFVDTAKWCTENPDTTPAASRNLMDNLIADYAYNVEWMPRRATRNAWRDICLEAFELARIDKNEQAQDYFWSQYRGTN